MAHWTERYLGIPYAEGANGPDAFNCWFFFAKVELEQFGRIVPVVPLATRLSEIARLFKDQEAGSGWAKVDQPRSGDAVMMAHLKYPTHIGIYVDDVAGGSVLHTVAGQGSALPSKFHLEAARWRITGCYRPAGEV